MNYIKPPMYWTHSVKLICLFPFLFLLFSSNSQRKYRDVGNGDIEILFEWNCASFIKDFNSGKSKPKTVIKVIREMDG